MFKGNSFMSVTNFSEEEEKLTTTPVIDPINGHFKLQTKASGAMPTDPDEFGARIMVTAVVTRMVAMKHPAKGVPRTAMLSVWENHVRYLYGQKC